MKEYLRTQLWVSLSVIVVFLMGLGAGILFDARLSVSWRPPLRGLESVGGRLPGRPPGRTLIGYERRSPGRMLRRLDTALGLSGEQTERLEALFQTQREQLDESGRDMRQQSDIRKAAFRTSVVEILTPTQMELFKDRFRGRRGRTRMSRTSRLR